MIDLFLMCAMALPSSLFTRPAYFVRHNYEVTRLRTLLIFKNETGANARYLDWDRSKWVKILAKRLDQRDPQTFEHSGRVSKQMVAFGQYLGWAEEAIQDGRDAAWLHDFGKICIPNRILFKPAKLDAEETRIMRTHVHWGVKLLARVPLFKGVAVVVRDHHEDFNGKGYPEGRQGAQISPIARALAVVDTFDVITHDRPYKKAKTTRWAFWEIRRVSGKQFDPWLVEKFIRFMGGQSQKDTEEPPPYGQVIDARAPGTITQDDVYAFELITSPFQRLHSVRPPVVFAYNYYHFAEQFRSLGLRAYSMTVALTGGHLKGLLLWFPFQPGSLAAVVLLQAIGQYELFQVMDTISVEGVLIIKGSDLPQAAETILDSMGFHKTPLMWHELAIFRRHEFKFLLPNFVFEHFNPFKTRDVVHREILAAA